MPPQKVKTGHPNLSQRVWYSIFPHTYKEQDDRRPYRGWLNTLVLHFRPKVVQERTLRFSLTCGLDEAAKSGWVVVSMQRDWKSIFPFEGN